MLTFKKGDAVKFVDEGSVIIAALQAAGWEQDNGSVRAESNNPRRGRPARVQDSEQ
jgi:hypothetical protein